jgi:hypothetical protein
MYNTRRVLLQALLDFSKMLPPPWQAVAYSQLGRTLADMPDKQVAHLAEVLIDVGDQLRAAYEQDRAVVGR